MFFNDLFDDNDKSLNETFHFQGYQIDVDPATKVLTVSRGGQVLHTEKTSMVGRPGGAESIKRRVSTIIDRLEDEKFPDDLEVRPEPEEQLNVKEDTKSDLYANAVKKLRTALSNPKLDPATRKDYEARLAKFQINELDPGQEEPESIDDKVSALTARIGQLEKETPRTRKGEVGGLEKTSYGQVKDPAVKRLLRKAHELAPYASNDLEAVFRYFEKVVEKDDETIDMLIKNHKRNAALIKFLNQENDRQEQEIQQGNQIDAEQEKKIKDLLDLMNAKEKRFQDYTALVARSRGEYPADMVQAAQTAQHVERTGRMPEEPVQNGRQLAQSKYSKERPIRESALDTVAKYYFKPIGTLPNDLTRKYGLEKDAKGWFLKKTGVSSTDFNNKLTAARRAFGEPEVLEQPSRPVISRGGYSKLDKARWQNKMADIRELEKHPNSQDPLIHQHILNRIQELIKIGHDNGWM